jgi:hypothetical protein
MDDDDFLERMQERFGFTEFVLIGLAPSESGDKDMDDMHIVSGPLLPPTAIMAILHGALGELIFDQIDEELSVH